MVDKNRSKEDLKDTFNKITFADLGKKCINETNGDIIQKKYPNIQGKLIGEKLHEERINWIKSIDRK